MRRRRSVQFMRGLSCILGGAARTYAMTRQRCTRVLLACHAALPQDAGAIHRLS
jgi:hypothetical protein